MKPTVVRLQQRYTGKIDFVVYDHIDQDQTSSDFANRKGVSAVPTMMLVTANGQELHRWEGTQDEGTVASAFDQALASR